MQIQGWKANTIKLWHFLKSIDNDHTNWYKNDENMIKLEEDENYD